MYKMFGVFMSSALILIFAVTLFPAHILEAQTSSEYEAKLRQEEAQLQAEIESLNKDVGRIEGQKSSIEQAIALIDAQIRALQAKIRLSSLTINNLSKDIGSKTNTVSELEDKLVRSQSSLANLMRRTDQNDAISLPEILLKDGSLSDFFVEVDSFQTLKGSLNIMMDQVRNYKAQTQEEKENLEGRKTKEANARASLQANQDLVDVKKKEQARLLSIKKGELNTYQQYVSEKQARISQIRSALFDLEGTDGIPFGDAYDYAVEAGKATGVRPAFILAILTQESDLGKNLGSCLVTDLSTGDGQGKNTGNPFQRVMYAPRDTTPFETLPQGLEKIGVPHLYRVHLLQHIILTVDLVVEWGHRNLSHQHGNFSKNVSVRQWVFLLIRQIHGIHIMRLQLLRFICQILGQEHRLILLKKMQHVVIIPDPHVIQIENHPIHFTENRWLKKQTLYRQP